MKTVTPALILQIGRENPVVHAHIQCWQNGQYASWEEAMMACVVSLAAENDQWRALELDRQQQKPFSAIVAPG